MTDHSGPTVAVTCGPGRFSRLRLAYPDQTGHLRYNPARARQLLARTRELPSTKRDLVALLAEYRHALHDLTAQPAEHL